MGIVTLPCQTRQGAAVFFHVIGVDQDRVFLVDLRAEWNRYTPVLDAIEDVRRYCNAVYGNKRIIVNDTKLGWRELCTAASGEHAVVYDGEIPLRIAIDYYMACQERSFPVGGA